MASTKVMVFVGGYLPGYKYGGPISSISNLVKLISDESIYFQIVTSDRDLGDSQPYKQLELDSWVEHGHNCSVFYMKPSWYRFIKLLKILYVERPQVIYLNSVFHPQYSIAPLFACSIINRFIPPVRVIIAPRSELMDDMLRYKTFKKKAFLILAKLFGLYKDVFWHATDKIEIDGIEKWFPGSHFSVINNCSMLTPVQIGYDNLASNQDILKIVYFSRISPKKNLLFLLEVLNHFDLNYILDVWGPEEDKDYYNSCVDYISAQNMSSKVSFKGAINKNNVLGMLSRYDVFCLPTKGENFGHVISEALCAGLVVLVSDKTPWKNPEKSESMKILSLDNQAEWLKQLEKLHSKKRDRSISDLKKESQKIYILKNDINDLRQKYKKLLSC